jgi:hypothetical protein
MRAMYRRAILAVMAAGCGDGRMVAGSDGGPVDATDRGLVQVHVTGAREKSGLRVYFQERSSSLSLATQTDDAGRARGFLGPDGFVTLVWGEEPGLTMWTYTGVQPGDELEFFEPLLMHMETPPKSISLFADDAGKPPLTLRTSCGAALAIFDMLPVAEPLPTCGDRMSFLLERELVYRYARDVDVSGESPRVDFASVYADYGTTTVTVSHVPADFATITQELLDHDTPLEQAFAFPVVSDGEFSAMLVLPHPEGSTLLTQIDPDLTEAQHVVDWRPVTSNIELAYDEIELSGATVRPRYQAATSSITWGEGAGIPGDLVRATLFWQEDERARTWVIIGPRGAEAALRLPVIPVDDLRPRTEIPDTVETFHTGEQGAWLRQHLHGRWLPQGGVWPTHGAAGRVVWRSL